MTGTIAREMRRPELRDLDRGEPAVADAPHPDRAVAPRLGGEPLDGVVAVQRLVLGVLVERDAARRPGPADVDPAQGVATCREVRAAGDVRVAPPVVLAVRDHLEDRGTRVAGSSVSGARQPQVGRQLHAVACRDPHVPAVSTSMRGAGSPARRPVIGVPSLGPTGPGRPARPMRRCRDGRTTTPGASRRRRVRGRRSRGASPTRTRGSRSGTTRSTDPTAARASTASSISRTSPRACSSSTTTTGSCSSASTATRSTRYSWEIPEGGVPSGETALEGAQRELREETGVRPPTGASSAASAPVELASPTSARSCSSRPA